LGHDLEQRVISRTDELRTSHAQLTEAQRLARIGSWEWDVINDEITWSDELFKIFGLTPSAFKPGYQNYLKMLHPDDKEWTDSVIKEAFRSKVPFDFYHRLVRPDGEVRILHGRGEAYADDKGNVFKLAGTGQDVTERKTAEDNLLKATIELEQKNKELERSNNELTAFSYVAGHDLQEPLRKIKYFIERIIDKEMQNLSETGIDYFRRMDTSATRMQRLIDDLLTYSRVDIAEKSFENTPINQLLEEVKSELNDSIHQKQATISSGHLFQLKVIPFQFRQLLINIISNSIKFSKPGIPPHIKLEASFINEIENLHARNGMQYYHLKVSDNGIGFEPEFKTRIFEIFQRLHGRKEFEGTGIGLSICKKIVENHHGFITAEGSPGQGATFNIYIEVPTS
jgi:PAS domain S-box-containing protein